MFNNINPNDNYITDKSGWELIKKYIPNDKKIYSPFYCDGKMKIYFKELGFDIIHEDEDFFTNYDKHNYDLIIDNPPYGECKKIFEKLKEINKPFIIICLSTLISCKYFTELFRDELQIIIPRKRITFSHWDTDKKKYTPPRGTFYYCYKMNLEKDIIFL